MSVIPPYLSVGDTIGIVCPAGYMPLDKIQTCMDVLTEWGFEVKAGDTVGKQFHYFSGTDDERLDDLQQMMDDDSVKAILCGRGGYGVGRIIDRLSFKKFKKYPKWIIGYSDITVLHSHLSKQYKIASLHSPMAAAFNDGGYESQYVQGLRQILLGEKQKYFCETDTFNNVGTATGKLTGGNLSILSHLIGTSSDINTAGKILFIEDIGEYIYIIDRMMYQLKRSGKLDKLAGLIIGSFTDMKDTVIPYGKDANEVILDVIKKYDYPYCFRFPVGHTAENYPLKIGVEYSLQVGKKKVALHEM